MTLTNWMPLVNNTHSDATFLADATASVLSKKGEFSAIAGTYLQSIQVLRWEDYTLLSFSGMIT